MVAFLVWAVATRQPEWRIQSAFLPSMKVKIFMVPGELLLLRTCNFELFYNGKKNAVCAPIVYDPFLEQMEAFKKEKIIPRLIGMMNDGLFRNWVDDFVLKFSEFDVLLGEEVKRDVERMEVEAQRRKEKNYMRKRKR
jgi:hypothetical protein